MVKKNPHYLSNKEMCEEVVKCQQEGKISERLGRMFLLLAERYSKRPNFSGYTYRDEMVANGVLACCMAVNKFNIEKSNNAFAYFTRTCFTAFIQILKKERRHQEIRDELLLENDMDPSFGYIERHQDDHTKGEE